MLSIVVPAYNEEKNILNAIKRIDKFFKKKKYELIIVNDGSKDATEKLVEEAAKTNKKIRLVNNPENRGKGYAIKNGVMHSKGEEILMIDADLSMSVSEYNKLEWFLRKGNSICIGSKRIYGSKIKRPLYRRIPGFIFGLLVNILLVPGIRDTQCGFKLFDAMAAKEVFKEQKVEGFSFDAEILYIAKKKNILIKEVPISLSGNLRESKVNVFTDSFRMLFDLIRIRLSH
jgi:dolichyl-phosphate beta-glucosyltransferase